MTGDEVIWIEKEGKIKKKKKERNGKDKSEQTDHFAGSNINELIKKTLTPAQLVQAFLHTLNL